MLTHRQAYRFTHLSIMTNEEKIRRLTREELVEAILNENIIVKFCKNKPGCEIFDGITDENCKKCIREWLSKEVCSSQ